MSTSRVRRTGLGLVLSVTLSAGIGVPAVFLTPATAHAADESFTVMTASEQGGDRVRALQHLLNANGQKVAIDGVYGAGTKEAVERFQRSKRLPVDGIAGRETFGELTDGPLLREGDKGPRVTAAQNLLRAHGQQIEADGRFGPATTAAVRAVQRSRGLDPDGIIGPKTWSVLFGGAGVPATPEPAPGPGDYTRIDPRRGCYDQKVAVGRATPRQRENARTIIAVGKAHGISERGQIIAIATALQESNLCNINFGDRDSVGLFQQRPRSGWGSPAQITHTVKSARAFYGVASHTNNPGLKDIPGWERMPLTKAAQKVQRSAFPNAYAKWEDEARWLVQSNRDVAPVQ